MCNGVLALLCISFLRLHCYEYLKFYCVAMSSGETPSLSFTVFDLKFTKEWLVFEIKQITKISSL